MALWHRAEFRQWLGFQKCKDYPVHATYKFCIIWEQILPQERNFDVNSTFIHTRRKGVVRKVHEAKSSPIETLSLASVCEGETPNLSLWKWSHTPWKPSIVVHIYTYWLSVRLSALDQETLSHGRSGVDEHGPDFRSNVVCLSAVDFNWEFGQRRLHRPPATSLVPRCHPRGGLVTSGWFLGLH